ALGRPPSTRETRTIRSRLTWPLSWGSEPVTTSIVGSSTTGATGSVVVVRLHARHRSGCRVRFWPHPEQRNRILLVIDGCDRRDRRRHFLIVFLRPLLPLRADGVFVYSRRPCFGECRLPPAMARVLRKDHSALGHGVVES